MLSTYTGACPAGGFEGSGPTPAPAHGRFYTYVLNNIDEVITIIYSQKYVLLLFSSDWSVWVLIAKKIVSKLPQFTATTWCKGQYIWDFKYSDPYFCLKCKETHLKFHSTSSSDPPLLFISAHAPACTMHCIERILRLGTHWALPVMRCGQRRSVVKMTGRADTTGNAQ